MAPDLLTRGLMVPSAMLLLLICLTAVQGWVYPTWCMKRYNGTRISCCPPFNDSACGSKDNRGSCMMLPASRATTPPDVDWDERANTPAYFFNATCKCKPNFMGPACGECALGLTGDRCDKPNVVYRRNILTYNRTQLITFLAELHYCKYKLDVEFSILTTLDRFRKAAYEFRQGSYYDHMCFIHNYVTAPFINRTQERNWINFAHGGTAFLTWHRLFMMLFERQMQKCLSNPSWGLPYYAWEFEQPNECGVICTNEWLGASDNHGRIHPESVLYHWRMACGGLSYPGSVCVMSDCECEREKISRQVGFSGIPHSTYADVMKCMNLPLDTLNYDSAAVNSARNCIEGFWSPDSGFGIYMHNAVHMQMGGTMALVPVSSNDPMFYLHHCNIDKIFDYYIWLNKVTPYDYPTDNNIFGHGAKSCIGPFFHCWRNMDMLTEISAFNIYYVY